MRIIDGQEVFDCPYCFESGVVEVANVWRTPRGARPLASFWSGRTGHLPICVVACNCSHHSKIANLPPFNSETMFLIDHAESTEAAATRFREWWSVGTRHARFTDFDVWNDGRE